jgi:hypothetical protein
MKRHRTRISKRAAPMLKLKVSPNLRLRRGSVEACQMRHKPFGLGRLKRPKKF